jgi:hypothetical protein
MKEQRRRKDNDFKEEIMLSFDPICGRIPIFMFKMFVVC